MILPLSLDNDAVYRGLDIAVDAGKMNLRNPPEEAITIMLANLAAMEVDPEEVVLTGSMAIWAYLAVFHALHGRTRRISYRDGVGRTILVAAHG